MAATPYFSGARRNDYLSGGVQQVQGWLNTYDRFVISSLCNYQTDEGIEGGVCEIGIHHGTLFLVLYLHLHQGERAVAVDLFGDQAQNIDRSGKGDLDIFLSHVDRVAGNREPLNIIAKNSLELSPAEITDVAGKVRVFSVDGGHTDHVTKSDIRLAEACLHEWGIVILDDVFNREWPGVGEGLADFFQGETKLVPFAIGMNKVHLCFADKAEAYRAALQARCRPAVRGTQEYHGSKVLLVGGETHLAAILRMTRLSGLGLALGRLRSRWNLFLDRLAYRTLSS